MAVLVAVPDSPEGRAALAAGLAEAAMLGTDLLVVNLALEPLDVAALDLSGPAGDVRVTVIDRVGKSQRDPAETVLDEIEAHDVSRLVIGLRRRSPVGKALLGSVSQRLLLDSPVPVVAVKLP